MASDSKFPNLFKPFKLGQVTLKNRFALAPMTRARAKTLIANNNTVAYYSQFDSTGLVITEGVHVSPAGRGWIQVPGIWTDEQTEAWKPVVEAAHKNGSAIYLQLWHQGRQSHSSFHDGKPALAPSSIPLSKGHANAADGSHAELETPREMTLEDIKQTIEEFKKAAGNAKKAGFDGVEIHSANGYLLDEFLQSRTNQRTDQYGGSIENRFRFVGEVLDAVISVWGADRVGIRFGPNGSYGDMGTPEYRELFTYSIAESGKRHIAYVHVMDGLAFGFHELGTPFTLKEARAVLPAGVAIIGNCGYTAETAEAAIASGDADLISFGRPYLNNPDFPERIANGWPLNDALDFKYWFTPSEVYDTPEGYVIPKHSAAS